MQNSHFEEEVHLRDYIKVLHRRWKLAVSVFAAVFVTTAVYTFVVQPVYEAETLLQVSEGARGAAILGELANLSTGPNKVETEMEVLKSRSLAAEVAKALGMEVLVRPRAGLLTRLSGGADKGSTFNDQPSTGPVIEELSVPAELLGKELEFVFDRDAASYTLYFDGRELLKGTAGQRATGAGVAVQVSLDAGRTGNRFVLIKNDLRVAAAGLLGNLKVSQVGRNTGVVRLTYRSTDAEKASLVLETMNRLYVNRDVDDSSRDAIATLDFITGQVEQVKDNLVRSQTLLDDFKVRTGTVALSQEAELLVGRVSNVEVEINRLNVQQEGLASLLDSMDKGSAALAAGMSALDIQSPELAALISDFSLMLRQREEQLREYTPQNPVVSSLDSQIELVAGQIRSTATAIRSGLSRREQAVRGVLDNYRDQLARLPEVERNLARLAKDVLIQEKIYSFLLEKEQETRILKASTVSGIRVVDPPTVPIKPVKPQKARNLLLGLVLGFMLGVGVVFFREYLDDSVKDTEDLETRVGVPVYGTIPFVKRAYTRRKEKKPHLVIEEMYAPVTEAFRTLRTNLFFSREGKDLKIVAVTSPGPGAGKSFVVANLAALSALLGKRTLIIDADMRHPQQHVVLGVEQKPGLSEVLVDRMTFQDAIKKDHVKDLRVLTSGKIPPNPAELLGSPAMKELLDGLREHYDMVIIDTPPVNLVADAL
ncbi:MAG: polysaccharide biosynthesis tyrosine autokinase, partial [bacterium]|nr:polysaccharide biosynthesis tyrosine autokinase [bacterium]